MKSKIKPQKTKVAEQTKFEIVKLKRGGARENAGRREKVYSEELVEKKLLIPASTCQYFATLAKSEREKVFSHYVEKVNN